MRDFTLGDFIESLVRGEETPQNEKGREQEHEKETKLDKAVDGLVDEIMASIKNEVDEAAKDFIECEKARATTFIGCREGYHSSIEDCIERPLSTIETNIVDTAFQFAFINGWLAHKKNGDNNDK